MRGLFPGLTPGAILFRPFGAGFALIFLVLTATGCGHGAPAPPPVAQLSKSILLDLAFIKPTDVDDPKKVFTCTDPSQAKALLWSEGIGLNIGPLGTAFDSKGSPLPAFVITDYDANENIQPATPLLGFSLLVNGKPAVADVQGYSQTLDTRYGLLTTHWFQRLDKGWLEVRASEIAEQSRFRATFEFRGPIGTTAQFINLPVDRTSNNWAFTAFDVAPRAVEDRNSRSLLHLGRSSEQAREALVTLTGGQATAMLSTHRGPAMIAGMVDVGFGIWDAAIEGDTEFSGRSPVSIDIDGPLDDQKAVNSFVYYLRGAAPSLDDPISPMGVSSSLYGGHTFWDADIWLSPAMAFIDPSITADIARYRLAMVQPKPNPPFSWESAISGRELAPPEFAKEIHIDGDVLWNLEFAKALGFDLNDSAVNDRVAGFYLSRTVAGPNEERTLPDVKSPDENHTGSNDLYTNLLAQWSLNGATWHPKASPVHLALPHDAQGFLTYDGDPVRSYKQAAAVLAIYPLQYPPAEAQARQMLNRFEDKVIPNGPAMSDSVHALIWARLGDADKAYNVWESSWKPFLKGPMLLFSEKRNQDRTYFTTGAAGCLQTVIYGFLGFRVDEQPKPSAAWQTRLRNGRWLSIDPHLPSAWKSVTFRNFVVLGRRYTLTVRREGAKTITTVR